MGHTLRLLWLRLRYGNRYTMNVWRRLEAQPGFNEELRQARADLKAGEGTPFSEVRR